MARKELHMLDRCQTHDMPIAFRSLVLRQSALLRAIPNPSTNKPQRQTLALARNVALRSFVKIAPRITVSKVG